MTVVAISALRVKLQSRQSQTHLFSDSKAITQKRQSRVFVFGRLSIDV